MERFRERYLFGTTRPIEPAALQMFHQRRVEVVGTAPEAPHPQSFIASLLHRIEHLARLARCRLLARMNLGTVVAHPQRESVGASAYESYVFRRQLTPRLWKTRLRPGNTVPAGRELDVDLFVLGQRPHGCASHALEALDY